MSEYLSALISLIAIVVIVFGIYSMVATAALDVIGKGLL